VVSRGYVKNQGHENHIAICKNKKAIRRKRKHASRKRSARAHVRVHTVNFSSRSGTTYEVGSIAETKLLRNPLSEHVNNTALCRNYVEPIAESRSRLSVKSLRTTVGTRAPIPYRIEKMKYKKGLIYIHILCTHTARMRLGYIVRRRISKRRERSR